MCENCNCGEVDVKEILSVNLTCPGCLRDNKMERFTIANKGDKSEVRRFANCPKCRMEYGMEFSLRKNPTQEEGPAIEAIGDL